MPFCNSQTFQLYLDEFSSYRTDELKLVVLDNGAFHKAKSLKIPNNIILVFLPPYSPELNPAEKMWWNFKRSFSNRLFKNLNEIEEFVKHETQNLETEKIKSICGYRYILSAPIWSNL